ncbi:MAG: hypoxanthine phosphoribosyltransferase [Bdellovibrionaceae bacterium]|nr:hypoxanthine phosphoribosyltransferase [Pseudobdellovibrionaceae bacterium]
MASNKKPSSNRGQLKDEMIAFLTSKDIAALVEKLAREIEADYKGKDLIFICPLKGSCLFLADLVRKIDRPLQVDFVQLGAVEKGGAIRMLKDISVNIAGKHVVIVEEIIDTGRTLDFLRQRLLASAPASLKILTLLDKPARRELQLKPDYTGQSIEDRYMVGYGMDSEEIGRNYSEIFYFKQ